MTIIRISEFRARPDSVDKLGQFLRDLMPTMTSLAGCTACQLLQGHDEPLRFVMMETWVSVEAHQAAVRAIPPSSFGAAMALLDGKPSGAYFRSTGG